MSAHESMLLGVQNQLGPSLVADSVGSLCYPSANLFFVQGAAVDAGICKQASPHRATSGIQSLVRVVREGGWGA